MILCYANTPSKKTAQHSGYYQSRPNLLELLLSMKSSPVKKSSRRSVDKYSSKFCAVIIDNVIQGQMDNVTKNVVTTEKWASKMKVSLLRKISHCSKVAFLPEAQRAEVLQELIEEELDKISVKTTKIKELAANAMKNSRLADVQVLAPAAAPNAGRFDKSVSQIGSQLAKVAHQLDTVKSSVDKRLGSLRDILSQVQVNWQPPASSSQGSVGSPSKKGKATLSIDSPMKNAGALGKLHDHLEKV